MLTRSRMPISSQDFVDFIIRLRRSKGLTQKKVAEAIGVDRSLVNRFEKRTQGLTDERLEQIARVCSPTPEDPVLTEDFVDFVLLRGGRRRFPRFAQLLGTVNPLQDFLQIMEETSASEREQLIAYLEYLKFRGHSSRASG